MSTHGFAAHESASTGVDVGVENECIDANTTPLSVQMQPFCVLLCCAVCLCLSSASATAFVMTAALFYSAAAIRVWCFGFAISAGVFYVSFAPDSVSRGANFWWEFRGNLPFSECELPRRLATAIIQSNCVFTFWNLCALDIMYVMTQVYGDYTVISWFAFGISTACFLYFSIASGCFLWRFRRSPVWHFNTDGVRDQTCDVNTEN